MWVRRYNDANGAVCGVSRHRLDPMPGRFDHELPEDHPDVLAYLNPPPPDMSDSGNQSKAIKAVLLCVAEVGGLTPQQIRTMFKAKWDALP